MMTPQQAAMWHAQVTIAATAERLMRILDNINPRFPIAPGKLAEIEETKSDLRAALKAHQQAQMEAPQEGQK